MTTQVHRVGPVRQGENPRAQSRSLANDDLALAMAGLV
jgi:hypothetical protein